MPKFLIDKISFELVEGTTQEEFLEKTYALDGDNITGVLPISKGGTGAENLEDAINNLRAIKKLDTIWTNSDPSNYRPSFGTTIGDLSGYNYLLVVSHVAEDIDASLSHENYVITPIKKMFNAVDNTQHYACATTQYYQVSGTLPEFLILSRQIRVLWKSRNAQINFDPSTWCKIGGDSSIVINRTETEGHDKYNVIIPDIIYGTNI